MMKLIQKIKSVRNYLSYQIFASFWLMLAILLAVAVALPNFDVRLFSPLEQTKRIYLAQESMNIQDRFNIDEIFERHLSVSNPSSGLDIILLDKKTGILTGIDQKRTKAFQAFIYKANDPIAPLQRRFDDIEISGPFLITTDKREYYQYFLQTVSPQRDLINHFFDSPWFMLTILMLISTPFLLWLSWQIAKPVKLLRASANAVATGDLTINPQLETEGINELREVGKSFNQMVTSLQNLTSYQQRLLSDISHELKTPLARLQLATALIRRRSGSSSELNRIENEIQKLDIMIHDLLSLSRQQLNQHLTRNIFTVNKIWDDVFEDAQFETKQNQINLFISTRITHPERYKINGNVSILASAVENVIRNAQKYAKDTIKVLTYIDKNDLVIVIDDNGLGVKEEQYTQIFRPFYRVDEARARETGGTGLGLAIVANAVQQHKGSVQAMQSPLGGLRIEIKLPLWIE